MSVLDRVLGAVGLQRRNLNNPAFSLNDPVAYEVFGGGRTAAGMAVNPKSALGVTAAYACIRLLCETVGTLPLTIVRRQGRGREEAREHPLWPLLHDAPNPEMSTVTFKELLVAHLAGWGNAFVQPIENRGGRIVELWPVEPSRVYVERRDGRKRLAVATSGGGYDVFNPDELLHVPLFCYDGLLGFSPIDMARQSIGMQLAMDEFGGQFFGNGAQPGGILTATGKLSAQAQKNLKESFEAASSGKNRRRVVVLEEGVTYSATMIPPEQAQFLESRKYGTEDVARVFRVPPHMIGSMERATFSNIEHQAIEFVKYTLMPYLVRIERTLELGLLTPAERRTHSIRFNVNALLRGDTKTRFEVYAIGRNWGLLSANDCRELEDRNPIDGGDEYLVPLNMRGITEAVPVSGRQPTTPRQLRALLEPLLRDAWHRVLHREAQQAGKVWPAGQDDYARRALLPITEALALVTADGEVRAGVEELVRDYLASATAPRADAAAQRDALVERSLALLCPTPLPLQEAA